MVRSMHAHRLRQLIQSNLIVPQPLRVGLAEAEPILDFLVGDNPAFHGIHQEHLPRLEAALHFDVFGWNLQHARFGSHHDRVVLCHDVAPGPQAIPVEHRTDYTSVGERHRRRTIPRLHQRRVVLVESPLLRLHVRIAGPRLRNHHGHHMRKFASSLEQQLHGVVEIRGVAAVRRNDGTQFLDVVPKQRRPQHRLPGAHPVHIAPQRVDFAVVCHVPVGMRELPAGKSIRRKALMDQTKRAHHIGIGELDVEIRYLRRQQQSFVHNRPRRK